ncbi:MAG TPA: hypothetical protein VKK31_09485 [Thermoanaerobaculia bacterium]|nr:hypothetical protein [Thermoanaerobaculia bacterium]
MQKHLSVPLSVLIVLVILASATTLWAATASFTPRPGGGQIFTVINFDQAFGQNQPTYVTIDWGSTHRTKLVTPYGRSCRRVFPAGFVLKLRQGGTGPLKITTTGTIVRGPYQGELPLELLNACYRLK